MTGTSPIAPPATLGVVGGGQLGRMFVQAAHRLGYSTAVLNLDGRDDEPGPAAVVAGLVVPVSARPLDSLRAMAARSEAVTTEFENISAAALRYLERRVIVRPGWRSLWIAQNRIREKRFLDQHGLPVAEWRPLRDDQELREAIGWADGPTILKTAASGYDGKGQARVDEPVRLGAAWSRLGRVPCVLERVVDFVAEVSCIVARGADTQEAIYPVFWNQHRQHILDTTLCPAPIGPSVTRDVQDLAARVARALRCVGLLTVEFFLTRDGHPIINELAPRPHNSGHLSIEACVTSQFEQQVRALCGLPLGSARLIQPAAMVNLLGDLWIHGEPCWDALFKLDADVQLHLYGKTQPRPGRKMGHVTVLDPDPQSALARVLAARRALELDPRCSTASS